MEKWKKVKGYESYEISTYGNIKSLKNNNIKILKPSKSNSGYLQIVLCKDGKTKNHFIHRLVAENFIENKNNYSEINHKDENKLNNHIDNLEWCTRLYNMNYGNVKSKISNSRKIKVVKMMKDGSVIKIYESIKAAAKENKVKETNIVKCCKNIKGYKMCGGYKWRYVVNS